MDRRKSSVGLAELAKTTTQLLRTVVCSSTPSGSDMVKLDRPGSVVVSVKRFSGESSNLGEESNLIKSSLGDFCSLDSLLVVVSSPRKRFLKFSMRKRSMSANMASSSLTLVVVFLMMFLLVSMSIEEVLGCLQPLGTHFLEDNLTMERCEGLILMR